MQIVTLINMFTNHWSICVSWWYSDKCWQRSSQGCY